MEQDKRSEAARQFDDIWADWNDPEVRAKKKLEKNRQEREETQKEDNGL